MKKFLLWSLVLTLGFSAYSQNENTLKDKYVLVMDMQESMSKEYSEEDVSNLLKSINKVIEKADKDKVIYVKMVHKLLVLSLKGIHVDSLPVSDLHQDLQVVNENVFEKSRPSALYGKELMTYLNANNVKDLVIVGVAAEECVYKTLVDAKKKGYNTYVIPGAIMGKCEKKKEKALKKLKKKGIKVLEV